MDYTFEKLLDALDLLIWLDRNVVKPVRVIRP